RPATTTLGSVEDLLHARALVDALLGRLAPVTSEDGISTTTKESVRARKKSKPLRSSPRRNLPVGNPQRGTKKTRHPDPGTTQSSKPLEAASRRGRVMSDARKAKPSHIQRAAFVFIRQSSPAQVE